MYHAHYHTRELGTLVIPIPDAEPTIEEANALRQQFNDVLPEHTLSSLECILLEIRQDGIIVASSKPDIFDTLRS